MTENPSYLKYSTPLACELMALFDAIPDEPLLVSLKPYYAGRRGYGHRVLWRTYVALHYLNIPTFAALIRTLQDNPNLCKTCGINTPDGIPSPFAYSRFMKKLAKLGLPVKNILRNLTRSLYNTLPDFGKSVAIDSTDMKAWSNPAKKGKYGKVSDTDAGWIVKKDTKGKKKYVWGYKAHILCDTTYELPIAVNVSAGNVHDSQRATPLLSEARYTNSRFNPDYVLADAAYSSAAIRKAIRRNYNSIPVIDPHPKHKKAIAEKDKMPDWKIIYRRRTSIERLNGRLKQFRRLDSITVRRRFKIRIHVMLSIIVCQAQALATGSRMSVRKVA